MSTGDTLAWLLEPDEPSVRYLALKELLGRPDDDPEVTEAKRAIMKLGRPPLSCPARMRTAGS